jgi:hypothetical protein
VIGAVFRGGIGIAVVGLGIAFPPFGVALAVGGFLALAYGAGRALATRQNDADRSSQPVSTGVVVAAAVADTVGISGLWEGNSGHNMVSGERLTREQQSQRLAAGLEGGIQLAVGAATWRAGIRAGEATHETQRANLAIAEEAEASGRLSEQLLADFERSSLPANDNALPGMQTPPANDNALPSAVLAEEQRTQNALSSTGTEDFAPRQTGSAPDRPVAMGRQQRGQGGQRGGPGRQTQRRQHLEEYIDPQTGLEYTGEVLQANNPLPRYNPVTQRYENPSTGSDLPTFVTVRDAIAHFSTQVESNRLPLLPIEIGVEPVQSSNLSNTAVRHIPVYGVDNRLVGDIIVNRVGRNKFFTWTRGEHR